MMKGWGRRPEDDDWATRNISPTRTNASSHVCVCVCVRVEGERVTRFYAFAVVGEGFSVFSPSTSSYIILCYYGRHRDPRGIKPPSRYRTRAYYNKAT
jgi:hypothetical protein